MEQILIQVLSKEGFLWFLVIFLIMWVLWIFKWFLWRFLTQLQEKDKLFIQEVQKITWWVEESNNQNRELLREQKEIKYLVKSNDQIIKQIREAFKNNNSLLNIIINRKHEK